MSTQGLPIKSRSFDWRWRDVFFLYAYLGILLIAVMLLPNSIWDSESRQIIAGMGLIGIWRYGWWGVHFLRSRFYRYWVFPRKRKQAEALWNSGWRPDKLYFMMTTFREEIEITHRVLQSIVDEARSIGVPTYLFLGTGHESDETIVKQFLHKFGSRCPFELILTRQNVSGKRMAIGAVLRAMARRGVNGDNPVIFMDGDVILGQDSVRKCLPFFVLDQQLDALTTDEEAVVVGPQWMQAMLDLRFSQRNLGMCSHALSNKVLTLTGRMSVFRAKDVIQRDFYRTIEADYLDHWLWGKFRFLSGDDKSTWYWLLSRGARMTYVPDSLVYTVEVVEGNGIDRMQANLLRWSGNMLRNGTRGIALGPKKVGLFIWWCLVDQRIAIWTSLVGPIAAITASIFVDPSFIIIYIIWVAFTRFIISCFLFPHSKRINMSYPFLMYFGQISNALAKAYIWFRLPKQRWANRGNQKAAMKENWQLRVRNGIAFYLTTLYITALTWVVMIYIGLLPLPDLEKLRVLFF